MSQRLIDLLWDAAGERFGITVESDDPDRLRQQLYAVRRTHLSDFVNIRLSVADGKVWILNREGLQEVENAETQRQSDST